MQIEIIARQQELAEYLREKMYPQLAPAREGTVRLDEAGKVHIQFYADWGVPVQAPASPEEDGSSNSITKQHSAAPGAGSVS